MRASGFEPEDYEGDEVEIWPEHHEAFKLFVRMQRRWTVSMNGPVGLDFGVLYRMMDRLNLTPERYDELEREIVVMEDAALEVLMARKD